MSVIVVFIGCVLFLLGLVKTRSKLLSFLILLYQFILFGLNTMCSDFLNYYNLYLLVHSYGKRAYSLGVEVGYVFLMRVCSGLNMDLISLRSLVYIIGITFFIIFCKRVAHNYTFVIAMYLLAPFFSDVMQIRNYVAEMIGLLAVSFLIVDKQKHSVLKYSLLIVLASMFQYSVLLYFCLLLIRIKNKKVFKNIIMWGTIFVLGGMTVLPILARRLTFIPLYKIEAHLTSISVDFNFLVRVLVIIVNLLILIYCVEIVRRRQVALSYNAETVLKINYVCLLFIPLMLFSGSFFRLYRNMMPVNYLIFSDVIYLKHTKGRGLFFCAMLFCGVLVLLLDQASVLKDIYINNLLW